MTISFPSSPTVNQTYTVGSKTWAWNGSTWKISSTALFITGDTAPTSPLAGSLWYDTTDATLYIRSGSAWLEAVIAKEGTPGTAGTSSNPYPIGNTASRPYSPTSGYTRINSDTNNIEVYYNSAWYNLQYIGIITATGGTVSYSGNYKIHTFTTTSTFIVADAPVGTMVQYLVVAGGGAGGGTTWQGGGGGAGGLLSGSALTVTSGITYSGNTYDIKLYINGVRYYDVTHFTTVVSSNSLVITFLPANLGFTVTSIYEITITGKFIDIV